MSSPLESKIDVLYQQPPGEFVAARTALARTLAGADAARVKRLEKPTTVAWAVNQVYWRSRSVYDRLMRTGEQLRSAQVATLKGKASDIRRTSDDHRRAITEAVADATRHLVAAGLHPDTESLARTFEALSVAREKVEHPGRLVKPMQPAGFEALAGIAVKHPTPVRAETVAHRSAAPAQGPRATSLEAARARHDERQRAAARARKAAAIEKAEAAVAHAKAVEASARESWERTRASLSKAEQALAALREAGES